MPFGTDTPTPATGSPEVMHVDSPVVACDGGNDALGHPRVWLRIADRQTFCPWCSRIYVLDETASGNHGH